MLQQYKVATLRWCGRALSYCLVVPIWLAWAVGLVRVRGWRNVILAVRKGNVVLAPNHPSLLETVAISALFWWRAWFSKDSEVPWSISDQYLFGNKEWVYHGFRCLRVSRETGAESVAMNRVAMRQIYKTLPRGVISGFFEGGRTCNGGEFVYSGERRVRSCQVAVIKLAAKLDATVVPVWVEFGDSSRPQSFPADYLKLFTGTRMTITFGRPRPAAELTDPQQLAEAILGVLDEE